MRFCSPALTRLRNFKPLFFWYLFPAFSSTSARAYRTLSCLQLPSVRATEHEDRVCSSFAEDYRDSSLDRLSCPMVWATCHKQTKAVSVVSGAFIPRKLLLSGSFPVEPASLLPHVDCLQHFCVFLHFANLLSSLASFSLLLLLCPILPMVLFLILVFLFPYFPQYWHAASCTVFLAGHFLPSRYLPFSLVPWHHCCHAT